MHKMEEIKHVAIFKKKYWVKEKLRCVDEMCRHEKTSPQLLLLSFVIPAQGNGTDFFPTGSCELTLA